MPKTEDYGQCIICGGVCTQCSMVKKLKNNPDDPSLHEKIKLISQMKIKEINKSLLIICNDCKQKIDEAYDLHCKCRRSQALELLENHERLQNIGTQTMPFEEKINIIINDMPTDHQLEKLKEIISKCSTIEHCYLSQNHHDNFASITFPSEDAADRFVNALHNEGITCDSKPLIVTKVSEYYAPIDVLPDDCLREIFEKIDYVNDKLEIEKVCKHWKKIGAKSWSNITSVTLECDWDDNVRFMKRVFTRCGSYIKDIKLMFPDDNDSCLIASLSSVGEYCKNIESFRLWYSLDNVMPNEFNQAVNAMIQNCSKLRRFFIAHISGDENSNFVNNLPKDIQNIALFSEEHTVAKMDFSKFDKLETLELTGFNFDEHSLRGIENLPKLKHLCLITSHTHQSNIRRIANLKTLTSLEIPNSGLNDNLLLQIIENNRNLRHLDIGDNPEITDRSLESIAELLPDLTSLEINNLPQVSALPLRKLRLLNCLRCDNCSSIQEFDLVALLDTCPRLDTLYVQQASLRLLMMFEVTLTLRTQKAKLYCYTSEDVANVWRRMTKNRKLLCILPSDSSCKLNATQRNSWYS